MCGIAGYIGKKQIGKSAIDKTLVLMKNRGPDYQNWCSFIANDTNVYMLHSRLSIIDLDERSNQPFSYNGFTLVFNGEIYNYIEVREELKKQGHTFTTDSDTEVLLKAYVEYGEDCVQHFNGMWAFAIWDERNKRAWLGRDRLGIKPLVYYYDEKIEHLKCISLYHDWDNCHILYESRLDKSVSVYDDFRVLNYFV